MTICPNCGSDSEDDAVFCEECGYQINQKAPKQPNQVQQPAPPTGPKKFRFVKQK